MGTSLNFLMDPYIIEDEIMAKRHNGRFRIRDERQWRVIVNGKDLPIHWLKDLSPRGLQMCAGVREEVGVDDIVSVKVRFKGKDFFSCDAIVKWKAKSRESVNMVDIGLEFEHSQNQPLFSWEPNYELHDHLESVKAKTANRHVWVSWAKSLLKLNQTEAVLALVLPFLLGLISTL